MKATLYIPVFIVLVVIIFSCNKPQPQASLLLVKAEQLIEEYPDSALMLIDSIFYPEKSLNKDNYMRYLVTRTQAKYKTYLSIEQDTLIFAARDYFSTKEKELRMAALSWFYSGCVYRERGELENAAQHYKVAETYSAETADSTLQGLIQYNIGGLFADQDMYTRARESYRSAVGLYRKHPKEKAYSLSAMGSMYLLDKKTDSAFLYYQKGLEVAERTIDNRLQGLLRQNIAVAYQEIGQYEEAEKYFRQSYQLHYHENDQSRYYLNFANLYYQMGQQDSVAHYAEKLKSCIELSNNFYTKASAFSFLSKLEIENGNSNEAFIYQNKRIESLNQIMEDRKNQSILEIEQKYNNEQQQNLFNKRYIRFQQELMLVMGILLVVAIVLLFVFIKMLKERAEKIKVHNNVLTLHATNKDLLAVEKGYKSIETELREATQWKLDLFKNIVQFKHSISENDNKIYKPLFDKLAKILFDGNSKTPWIDIIQTVEYLYPELPNFIKQQNICLSETEYNVCLLSHAGLSVKEIAFLLNLSEHTIYKARTNLNKKIGPNFTTVLR